MDQLRARNAGIECRECEVSSLLYVDDIVLLAPDEESVQVQRNGARDGMSLLCYTKNSSVTFKQTKIGSFFYAHGLHNKRFKILNAFDSSSNIDNIQHHSDYWSSI